MKRSILAVIMGLFCCVSMTGCVGCETVRPGYVGIMVPLYGSKEAKTEYQTVYGRVWYNSWYNDVYIFPTFMQQVVWTKNANEGNAVDESISFSSTEGKVINCDIALAYSIKAEFVTQIFRDQRKTIEQITDVYLRSKVRDSFVRHAAVMKVSDIMGPGKEQLTQAAKKDLVTELGPKGYVIDMVSIVGEMRVDEKVREAIGNTIQALQLAIAAENKVKQSEAEARQEVAKAQGASKAVVTAAEGKAKAILTEAEAQAKANEIIQKSLTPEVLQYQALKSWNGQLPLLGGGQSTSTLLNIDPFNMPKTTAPGKDK